MSSSFIHETVERYAKSRRHDCYSPYIHVTCGWYYIMIKPDIAIVTVCKTTTWIVCGFKSMGSLDIFVCAWHLNTALPHYWNDLQEWENYPNMAAHFRWMSEWLIMYDIVYVYILCIIIYLCFTHDIYGNGRYNHKQKYMEIHWTGGGHSTIDGNTHPLHIQTQRWGKDVICQK